MTNGKLWLSVTCQWNWLIYTVLSIGTEIPTDTPHLDQAHGVKRTLDIRNWEAVE